MKLKEYKEMIKEDHKKLPEWFDIGERLHLNPFTWQGIYGSIIETGKMAISFPIHINKVVTEQDFIISKEEIAGINKIRETLIKWNNNEITLEELKSETETGCRIDGTDEPIKK